MTHSSVLMRQQAEQRRWRREAEQRERAAKLLEPAATSGKQNRSTEQDQQHGRRIAAIEQQLEAVRVGYRQAVAQRTYQEAIDALHAWNNPPQPPEPEIVVIEHHPADDLPFNGFLKRL
jgi:hypothetical protein